MIHELILFATFLGIGALFRLLYKALTLLENKINSVVATVILDVLLSLIGIGATVAACFFLNDGRIMPYMIISEIIGFVLVSLFW